MRANQKLAVIAGTIWVCCTCLAHAGSADAMLESPSPVTPAVMAAIFPAPPSRSAISPDRSYALDQSSPGSATRGFERPVYKLQLPHDWEEFEDRFAREEHPGQPTLELLGNGIYHINEMLFSVKLFERNVNSMMNFAYTLHEIAGYDSSARANRSGGFLNNASVKSDFKWDVPVQLYVGLRFEIRCSSVFQFWK